MAGILDALTAIDGVSVTYNRGAAAVALTALPGQTEFSETEVGGSTTVYRSHDFLCNAADLVLSGSTVTPEIGDSIVYDGKTYEVLGRFAGRGWRYTDQTETILRIHTKRTDEL